MAFNSFNFWLIFPFLFTMFWVIPSQWVHAKKWFLILVSYLLYMNWKPAFAIVLLLVTLVTYYGSKLYYIIEKKKLLESNNTKANEYGRKWIAVISVILTLLPLLVFKYYNFFNENVSVCLSALGLQFSLPGLNYAIPIGISFFTFQAIGYLFDVIYGKIKAEESITDYILFVSFFPQVISGPISKASELLPQIKNLHPFDYSQGVDGLKDILWGTFLKVVVADKLAIYVDMVYANFEHYSGLTSCIASIFYSFQIYADFAGYTLLALGIAKILGFNLINNFKQPYFSITITDFWHRWHISLSRWLKDYVYIPMGGSRCSILRNYQNILVTFLVSGIWHGASWNFIIWGVLHGIIQVFEKMTGLNKSKEFKWLRIPVIFILVNFLWMIFRVPSISDLYLLLSHIVHNPLEGGILKDSLAINLFFIFIVLLKDLYCEYRAKFSIHIKRGWIINGLRWAVYVGIFIVILLFGVFSNNQFIYASF